MHIVYPSYLVSQALGKLRPHGGLGSVANVTEADGDVLTSYVYDAFGAIRSQTFPHTNYWGFAGEQRDAESGFMYLRERYYDVESGRFLSQDPLGGGYPYAASNPVNFVDPSGLIVCPTDIPGGGMQAVTSEGAGCYDGTTGALVSCEGTCSLTVSSDGVFSDDTITVSSGIDPDTGAPVDPHGMTTGVRIDELAVEYTSNPGWHPKSPCSEDNQANCLPANCTPGPGILCPVYRSTGPETGDVYAQCLGDCSAIVSCIFAFGGWNCGFDFPGEPLDPLCVNAIAGAAFGAATRAPNVVVLVGVVVTTLVSIATTC